MSLSHQKQFGIILFATIFAILFSSTFTVTLYADPTCSFSAYANGTGPHSINGFKFWAGLPSDFYEISISVNNSLGNYAVYLVEPSNNLHEFLTNQSQSTIREYFAANNQLPSMGGYNFRVTPQGDPSTIWCESETFYQGTLPILSITTTPAPMIIGNQAEVEWNISGGLAGLPDGGWTGDIRLQWYQSDTPLKNLSQIPVSNGSYTFTVPDSISGGTVPGTNFQIAGANADSGSSIPGGMVSDFSAYFNIESTPPDIIVSQRIAIDSTRTNSTTIYSLPPFSEYGNIAPFESEKNIQASFIILNNGPSTLVFEDWGIIVSGGVSTDFRITAGGGFSLSPGATSNLFNKRGYITDNQLIGGSQTTFNGKVQVKINGTWMDALGSDSNVSFSVYPRPSLTNGMLVKRPRNEISSDPNDAIIYYYQNGIKWEGTSHAYNNLFPAWETEYSVYSITTIDALSSPSTPLSDTTEPMVIGRNLLYKDGIDVYIIEPEPNSTSPLKSRLFEEENAFYSYGFTNPVLQNEPIPFDATQVSWIQSQYPIGTTISDTNNGPYFNPEPMLPSEVVIPGFVNFISGVAVDNDGLSSIRMEVTKPGGETVLAFTDDTVAGLTSRDFTIYWFGSNQFYSGVVGPYMVKLIITAFLANLLVQPFCDVQSIQYSGSLTMDACPGMDLYSFRSEHG